MATRELVTPVGTDLVDITGATWQIAGIVIDNPSGSWLQVSGINQYVPPYVLGWSYPVAPTQASLSVRFVDSPSGTPSGTQGGPVTVRISDVPVPAYPGIPSGAYQSEQPSTVGVSFQHGVVFAAEGGELTIIFVPAFGKRIVPLSLTIGAFMPNAWGPGSDNTEVRSICTFEIISSFGGSILPPLSISPAAPIITMPFPAGLRLLVNEEIRTFGWSQPGSGRQAAQAALLRYEVSV